MKIRINQIEVFTYFLVVLLVFIVLITDVLIFKRVSTRPPTRADQPEISDPPPEPNLPEGSPQPLSGLLNVLQILAIVVVIVLVVYFIYQSVKWIQSSSFNVSKRKQKEIAESITRIKDARARAYQIIHQGLQEETYTKSFVDAYHALDESLDYFREIRRPKYWTPKEYAYSVSEPVFQASVYRFVDTFYRIRYGLQKANRQDLLNFKTELDFLFIDDVPSDIFDSWERDFSKTKETRSSYQIRRVLDPTKPGGGLS